MAIRYVSCDELGGKNLVFYADSYSKWLIWWCWCGYSHTYMLLHCVTDGVWYRAMSLADEFSREKNVIFLDFGNMAYVEKENIRKMIKDYVEDPALAVMCSLHGNNFWLSSLILCL